MNVRISGPGPGPGRRPARRLAAGLLALLALLAAAPAAAEVAVPYLSGRVVDLADMISGGAEQQLDAELAKLETETGAQVAVLTVPTLEDEPIETFALRVVEAWKLGREKQDDGALLLIARDDRKMRIEVGYGLEGALPDVIAKRILAERLAPRFQAGDFDGGIAEAVATLGGVVRGEAGAMPPERQSGGDNNLILLAVIGFVVFNALLPMIFSAARSKRVGWILYPLVAIPAYGMPAVMVSATWGVIGLVAWLVIFPLLRMFSAHLPQAGASGGGGWVGTGGGWSSGGGGGWSSGGGGFSGGGGSFGGGGASDSW